MIRIFRWDPAAKACTNPSFEVLPATAAEVTGQTVVWVDLQDPTPAEEERVLRTFLPVHSLTLEDIVRARPGGAGAHLPKVEEFPDYLFVVVNPLPPEMCRPEEPKAGAGPTRRPRQWTRPQLSAVLTHNVLVTHHYGPVPAVDDAVARLGRHGGVAGRGPDYLFHLVLDEMVDDYAPVVERFAERLDRLETVMFRRPTPDVLARLLRLKREVTFLRKTLVLEREVLARLVRGEFELVDDREMAYYRNVSDHIVRYTELVETAREMVSDLMQTHLSAASNRLNEVVKVLTMISTVILPMTLVAGIYGMNFEFMPELKWVYGYPMALLMMAGVAVVALGAFRWKRWL